MHQDYDDERLITLWNSVVQDEDDVMHFGRFSF